MKFRVLIPNFLTCMNLVCGCLGITFAINENLTYSAILICVAAIFDFADGFAARMLHGGSELGKQLDSLSDMVSFGVLPGIILYQFIVISFKDYYVPFEKREIVHILLSFTAFLVPVFSALRLAKFNIDTRQGDRFLGLPTPANAIFIASFPLILGEQYDMNFYTPPQENVLKYFLQTGFFSRMDITVVQVLFNPYFYIASAVILSALLVFEIPLLALKFKSWRWERNKTRYLLLIISVLLCSTVYYTGLFFLVIPIIFFLYLAISTVYYLIKKNSFFYS